MECAGKGSRGRCCGPPTRLCSRCEAVAYCSISHQISHWSIHKDECERLEWQMKQAEVLNDFPFTFSQEAIDAQFHEKHESRCSFLIRQGVHQLGMWSYECSCGASTSSSLSSSRLIDGWNLASTLSPCKGPSFSITNQLTCWKDYYEWRCIPLYSPVALLLHWPLTLHWANQLVSSRGLLSRVSGKFCIHYLGPEKELYQLAVFGELHALFPGLEVHIDFVGPAIPQERDGERVDLCRYAQCRETNCECKSATHFDGQSLNKSSKVTIQLHAGYYHDVHKDLLKGSYPNLIVAPNAGIAAYRSWLPTIELLKEMKVPAVFSDLCEEASCLAISCISTITGSPPAIPAACIPTIFSGADTVVAAETGSGKTHGYLVPLIDMLCGASDSSEEASSNQHSVKSHHQSLVLCPNVMLCEQVVRMANCLLKENGEPLLSIATVCGRQGWPVQEPDIIVSTPVGLLNYLYAIDPAKSRRSNFLRGVKYIVFDEADMLLCGRFQNQVICIINMLRFDEQQLSRLKSLKNDNTLALNNGAHIESSGEDDGDLEADVILDNIEDSESDGDFKNVQTQAGAVQKNDWRRVRKIYERSKQYIFVAATLPVNGKKAAGGVLKRMYPDASWVTGNYVHRHNPRLEQKWIEVTVDTQVDALISAVNDGIKFALDPLPRVTRTMIFANTVEAVVNILNGAGIKCFQYHCDSSLDERTKNLLDFLQKGGAFVCTDASARGLDVPNVSHVIQAEFATSAVDFLHRVGRTARAGQPGLVTSLYKETNRELVAAIRRAEKLGQPVESAFSRKRSFRNKLKKRGIKPTRDACTTGGVLA